MRTLNKAAAEALAGIDGLHSCTDITGFGLVGHATEMAVSSQVTLTFRASDVPVFDDVLDIVRQNRSGGLASNQEHFEAGVDMAATIPAELQDLFYDPQTSGGLLMAIDQLQADHAINTLARAGVTAWRIGVVSPLTVKPLHFR